MVEGRDDHGEAAVLACDRRSCTLTPARECRAARPRAAPPPVFLFRGSATHPRPGPLLPPLTEPRHSPRHDRLRPPVLLEHPVDRLLGELVTGRRSKRLQLRFATRRTESTLKAKNEALAAYDLQFGRLSRFLEALFRPRRPAQLRLTPAAADHAAGAGCRRRVRARPRVPPPPVGTRRRGLDEVRPPAASPLRLLLHPQEHAERPPPASSPPAAHPAGARPPPAAPSAARGTAAEAAPPRLPAPPEDEVAVAADEGRSSATGRMIVASGQLDQENRVPPRPSADPRSRPPSGSERIIHLRISVRSRKLVSRRSGPGGGGPSQVRCSSAALAVELHALDKVRQRRITLRRSAEAGTRSSPLTPAVRRASGPSGAARACRRSWTS